jgi:ubiquinone/menaquinone biosynthesis C-methylase UbiE
MEREKTVAKEADFLEGKSAYQRRRIERWDSIAETQKSNLFNSHYHRRLQEVYSFFIPQGSKILELGCGNGDLLASLKPAYGVGIDFSPKTIEQAKREHPELELFCFDVSDLSSVLAENEPFDFIVLSDLLDELWDVQSVLQTLFRYCHSSTRVVLNFYSRLWQIPLTIAQWIGLAKPVLMQNWLTKEDVANLINISDFEVIKSWGEVLLPIPIPWLDPFFNKFLVKLWPFKSLAITNLMLARPRFNLPTKEKKYSVSVVVPARNEEGNIDNIFRRIPQLGAGTELLFVEGNSKDNTYATIEAAIKKFPEISCRLFHQEGIGKGDAVRKGFSKAGGDILMVLDADLTVPPEYLPRFYQMLIANKGDFINGVRLVYPREKESMQFFNFLGNKFFSLAFSWLLGQPIKDTLCGTKVLWKNDYLRIAANRSYFGDFDPFGDFDLLFGASRLGLKIVDLPIRYQDRTYGTTNIQRWKHGWLLLKMVFFAAQRIKFV